MSDDYEELQRLETIFASQGGRGVDLAEKIDALRTKLGVTALTYNWQDEREGFLKWLLPALMHTDRMRDKLFDATDRGNNVKVQIIVSGVEVDAAHFFTRIQQNMDSGVKGEALRLVNEATNGLCDKLTMIWEDVSHKLIDALREAGLEINEDDYYR